MRYKFSLPNRRSIRFKDHDYSMGGLYFVTLVCQDRAHFFGHVKNGEMHLNEAGKMVEVQYLQLRTRFQNLRLHAYVIMPNHFHSIIGMLSPEVDSEEDVGATLVVARNSIEKSPRLGDILGVFKSITTVEYIRGVKERNWMTFRKKLWQRNYYERIIYNERAYQNYTDYIIRNPEKWEEDKYFKGNRFREI